MKTGVEYLRYSSDRQTEQSIEGQKRVCDEFAKRNDIVIVDTYIDRAMTGTNDNREAFQQMLKDSGYIAATRSLILSERSRMFGALSKMSGCRAYTPYANFILVRITRDGLTSYDVFEKCIKKGLMIRDCSSFQCLDGEYVRFCIMMPGDNTRLLDVFHSEFSEHGI